MATRAISDHPMMMLLSRQVGRAARASGDGRRNSVIKGPTMQVGSKGDGNSGGFPADATHVETMLWGGDTFNG
jgi:hypothetical protein